MKRVIVDTTINAAARRCFLQCRVDGNARRWLIVFLRVCFFDARWDVRGGDVVARLVRVICYYKNDWLTSCPNQDNIVL